ncbi:cyanophycinase [Singulisphaera sp. Ch08]|uniref:Cyanophycinase n=1 Tax=Singulisphaera sp. Ch08 TaxID=3120278 RepID=A0AAU7CG59_9BACT
MFVVLALTIPDVSTGAEVSRGNLLLIGGGLRSENARVYGALVELAGGKDRARIGIIPAASSLDMSARRAAVCLVRHGVPKERILIVDLTAANAAEKASDPVVVDQIRGCTGLFIAGGDQRLAAGALLGEAGRGTPALDAIREVLGRGGVVAGTSAGAAVMGDLMISAAGDPIDTLDFGLAAASHHRGVLVSRGLGLFPAGVVDQHFNTRNGRLARLARALVERRIDLGFGIDEDTAVLVREGGTLEILGTGGVTIVDATRASLRDGSFGVTLSGLVLDYLEHGDRYNVATRSCLIHPDKPRIAAGGESFGDRRIVADLGQAGALRQAITRGLVDNTAASQVGLLLDFAGDHGRGYRFTFSETSQTRGYFGQVDGNNSYAAQGVRLDVRPIAVQVDSFPSATPPESEGLPSEAARAIANRGILPADRYGRIRPDEPITRAEFASALARATGLERGRGPTRPASDVAASSENSEDIMAVISAGLMDLEGGAFRPESFVSSAEMASAFDRALRRVEPFASIDRPRVPESARRVIETSWVPLLRKPAGSVTAPVDPFGPARRGEMVEAFWQFLGLSR